MDDETNVQRLTEALAGTGCEITRARVVWVLNANLTDDCIARLAGWAQLEFLMADYTVITDVSVPVLDKFPLTDLSIGETSITAGAILSTEWPTIQNLGISGIDFSHHSIDPLLKSTDLTVVNANGSHLDAKSVVKLARLPKMTILEADTADVSHDTAREISLQHAEVRRIARDSASTASRTTALASVMANPNPILRAYAILGVSDTLPQNRKRG